MRLLDYDLRRLDIGPQKRYFFEASTASPDFRLTMDFTALGPFAPGSIRCQRPGARWHVPLDGTAVVNILLIYCVLTRGEVREMHDTKDRNTRLDLGKERLGLWLFTAFG